MNIIGFLRYNKVKKFTIQAWIYCAIYRFLIWKVPMRKLEKHFGARDERTSKESDEAALQIAMRVSYAVNRVADKTPWESKCWVRALAAQKILAKYHIPTTLYMGAGNGDKGEMIAHAWLRYGRFYVTGAGELYRQFAVTATFVKKC